MGAHADQLLDHFQNPRNAGVLENPSAVVEVENPACGDLLKLSARVEDGRIADVRYQVRGCTASIAAGSALTEWMTGKSLTEIRGTPRAQLTNVLDVALGGLESASRHAAVLCADGLAGLLRKL